jgi:hypothetical protein
MDCVAGKELPMNPIRPLIAALLLTPFCTACSPGDGNVMRTPGTSSQAVQTSQDAGKHCILPWGADWNAALDTNRRLVIPACPEVYAHEKYAPLFIMIVNSGTAADTPLVYPPGYVPARALPMDDFRRR